MLTNNLDFKRAIAQHYDPTTDYSTADDATVEGAFEATVLELVMNRVPQVQKTDPLPTEVEISTSSEPLVVQREPSFSQDNPLFTEVDIPEIGDAVNWRQGQGKVVGKVAKLYTRPVTIKIEDHFVTRNGSKENPALLITNDKGDAYGGLRQRTLKLASEVRIVEEVSHQEVEPAYAYAFEFDGKYDHIDLYPSKGMIDAAKQALDYLNLGFGGDGLESETIRWVRKVALAQPLSIEKCKKGYKFFQRHNYYKDNGNEGDTNPGKPAPWYVARLCWFGDPGESFFNRVWRQIKSVDSSADMEESPEFRAVIHRVVKWGSSEIGLEYMPGETRFRGTKHAKKLRSGYGHIRNHKGTDKEALDCYLAPSFFNGGQPSNRLFEINQVNPQTGEHDEQKMMIGYDDIDHAQNAYIQEMTPQHMGGIREMLPEELEKYKADKPQFSEASASLNLNLKRIVTEAMAEFSEPVKITGEILTEDDYDALSTTDSSDIKDAVQDWKETAPQEFANLLNPNDAENIIPES